MHRRGPTTVVEVPDDCHRGVQIVELRAFSAVGLPLESSRTVRRVPSQPEKCLQLQRLFGAGSAGAPVRLLASEGSGMLMGWVWVGCVGADVVPPPRPAVWDAWAREVMVSWPTGAGCEAPREGEAELVGAAEALASTDPLLRVVRYLALQCDLAGVQTALVNAVSQEWSSLSAYRSHCYAGGSARDPRCLVVLAVEGECRGGRFDGRCAVLPGHDGQVSVTTNASVPVPSSSTSTSATSPSSVHAASSSGR